MVFEMVYAFVGATVIVYIAIGNYVLKNAAN